MGGATRGTADPGQSPTQVWSPPDTAATHSHPGAQEFPHSRPRAQVLPHDVQVSLPLAV